MIKAILTDFSKVLLFSRDKKYTGGLNELNNILKNELNYNFNEHFELNKELLYTLEEISKKIPVYMFTRATIQDAPEIRSNLSKVFKEIFSSIKTGLNKSKPESYKVIAEKIKLKPEEVFYIDDKAENVNAALGAGCNAEIYKNNQQIISKIKSLQI